jgi:PAS domain S-box-containing protein
MERSHLRGSGVQPPDRSGRRVALAATAAVLALGLAVTGAAWRAAVVTEERELRQEFALLVRDVETRIAERAAAHEQILRSAAALFGLSPGVGRGAFRDYVAALHLEDHYPGIEGIGFVPLVRPARLAALEEAVRREGYPDFAVTPAGRRDAYAPVVFLEPFAGRNLRAFGYDILSEPVRRVALETARDEGRVALTGRVTLVQEGTSDVQPGFLLYAPVYRGGVVAPPTVAERRARLVGWVSLVFRMGDLLAGTLGEERRHLRLRVYEGATAEGAAPFWDSAPGARPSRFETTRTLEVADRAWTVAFSAPPGFEAQVQGRGPRGVATWSAVVSLLLAALTFTLVSARDHAVRYAAGRNRELTRTNAALRAEEERLASLIDLLPVPVALSDARDRVVTTNRAFRAAFGYTLADVPDVDAWFRLAYPDPRYREAVRRDWGEAVGRAVAGRAPAAPVEVRIRVKSGQDRWAVVAGAPLGEDLVVTFVDVTERRRAEGAVGEREVRLRRALAAARQAEWEYELATGRRIPGEGWERVTGRTGEEGGDAARWAALTHPDDLPRVRDAVRLLLEGTLQDVEYRVAQPGGGWRWVRSTGAVVAADDRGRPLRVAGTITDVTALHQLQARAVSAERLAATGVLARGLAHEINSPLSSLLTNVRFVREQLPLAVGGAAAAAAPEPSDAAELAGALEDAEVCARRIGDLVADLRLFALGDLHRGQPAPSLADAVRHARRIARQALETCRSVTEEVPPVDDLAIGYPDLVLLLTHLLTNAAQATAEGPNDVRVEADAAEPARVTLRIRDTGTGMSEETLARAFEPFFGTRGVGKGRGLGLSVCLGIVNAAGGELTLESAAGQGTTVTVVLPRLGAAGPVPPRSAAVPA